MGKGSKFERDTCKQLSMWWTGGLRKDIFWRSQTSGARATTAAKAGQTLAGQYGDIAATDPCGVPLLRIMTLELKRGYNRSHIHEIIDKPPGEKPTQIEAFVNQAVLAHEREGSYAWGLILRRDRRDCWIYIPTYLVHDLDAGALRACPPHLQFIASVRHPKQPPRIMSIAGYTLENFLAAVQPATIQKLWEEYD